MEERLMEIELKKHFGAVAKSVKSLTTGSKKESFRPDLTKMAMARWYTISKAQVWRKNFPMRRTACCGCFVSASWSLPAPAHVSACFSACRKPSRSDVPVCQKIKKPPKTKETNTTKDTGKEMGGRCATSYAGLIAGLQGRYFPGGTATLCPSLPRRP